MTFKVKLLHENSKLPVRSTSGSAGYDLCARLDSPVTISPGAIAKIGCGIAIEIDFGYCALVFGRSGLGVNSGVSPANAVGVVDSDYRGEIIVGLINHGKEAFTVESGDRIAQMLLMPVATPDITITSELSDSGRGSGGFGSTGIKGN